MKATVTRRRFISLSAAAVGLELLPPGTEARAGDGLATWRGVVLGAEASLQIHHPNRATGERLVELSLAEARRLERIFSLYRQDSVLAGLNRRGVLEAPPAELVELLEDCRRYGVLTGGAFDPTVQPLWLLYLAHFARPGADPEGPAPAQIEAALKNIGFSGVLASRDRVALSRRGMALTLNGIAQGYITDRIVALLRAHGIDRSFVDMGEARAIGARPDGAAWQIGIADPERPGRIMESVRVIDQAVATSGGYGFRFDEAGRFNHLFDPRTGRSPHRYRSVTVVARTATAADALSTAFSLMPVDAIRTVLRTSENAVARLLTDEGERVVVAG
jgi:thiamine biosynthesis lipoprotein